MQGRSWMAALAVIAGTVTTSAAPIRAADAPPSPRLVRVDLRIAGLGHEGCTVEIKPGHAGCKFDAVTEHVDGSGQKVFALKNIRISGADRDCAVAITIKEPGHPVKTVHRGLRLSADTPKGTAQTLSCYLNSPSKIARAEAAREKR